MIWAFFECSMCRIQGTLINCFIGPSSSSSLFGQRCRFSGSSVFFSASRSSGVRGGFGSFSFSRLQVFPLAGQLKFSLVLRFCLCCALSPGAFFPRSFLVPFLPPPLPPSPCLSLQLASSFYFWLGKHGLPAHQPSGP